MNDVDLPLRSSLGSEPGPSESGGSLLRQAREAAGFSVSELALLLKVSTAKLDALESNRWDLLPDIVFARALASSVCRALQIEIAPILVHFPSLTVPSMKTDESGINAPFRVPGDGLGFAWLSQFQKPGTFAVIVLVFAAVALFLLPDDFLKSSLNEPVVENGNLKTNSIEAVSTDMATNVTNQPSSASEAIDRLPRVDQLTPEKAPATAELKEMATSSLPTTAIASESVTGVVVLKATSASWVEVVDSRGVVQVRKTMVEGEVLGASGEGPLTVVIGRADAVSVEVRGKAFDLTNVIKNNVARFEVK